MTKFFNDRWRNYGWALAETAASISKDPSTKVGAVILAPDKTVVSTGFNGFPRKMPDYEEFYIDRKHKYDRIIHAEMNAILFANRSLRGCALFVTPLMCCPRCAVHIAQTGISTVYARIRYANEEQRLRWEDNEKVAVSILKSCGVSSYREYANGEELIF